MSESRFVSQFEANLIAIARYLVHHRGPGDIKSLIREKMPRQQTLSENALHLIRDTLSKGCVLFLVRQGGWRHERFLRHDQALPGRVWERIPLAERVLQFSRTPLDYLLWMTCDRPQKPEAPWRPADRTPADDLFFAMAMTQLANQPDVALLLRDRTVFAANGLCRLASPELFGAASDFPPPNFVDWFTAPRVAMLESLQLWLANRWIDQEFHKGQIGSWAEMDQLGRSQLLTVKAFIDAARAANRFDMVRFLLNTAKRVFGNGSRPLEFWFHSLTDATAPPRLADRLAIRRSAMALPRAIVLIHDWIEAYRDVGYFDEGYAQAQFAKAEWEAYDGESLVNAARASLEAIEPLQG